MTFSFYLGKKTLNWNNVVMKLSDFGMQSSTCIYYLNHPHTHIHILSGYYLPIAFCGEGRNKGKLYEWGM